MGYITDTDALKLAKQYCSAEKYEAFAECLKLMRHVDDCLVTGTPSPRCKFIDPAENLKWCRVGYRIEETNFCDILGDLSEWSGAANQEEGAR
jgi:hypothetical protein